MTVQKPSSARDAGGSSWGKRRADVPVNTRAFSFWEEIPGSAWVLWALVCVVVGTWVVLLIPEQVDRARAVAGERLCSEAAAPCLVEETVSLSLVEDDAVECGRGCTYWDAWEITDPDGRVHWVELDVRSSDWFGDGDAQAQARLFRTSADQWSLESLYVEASPLRDSGWEPVSEAGWGTVGILSVAALLCLRTVAAVAWRLPHRIRVTAQAAGPRAAWWGRVAATDETRVDPHALPWAGAGAAGMLVVLVEGWLWLLPVMVTVWWLVRAVMRGHGPNGWERVPSVLWAATAVVALVASLTALLLLPVERERARAVDEQRICGVVVAPCLHPVEGTLIEEGWGWFVRPDSDPTQEWLLTVPDARDLEDAVGEKVTLLVFEGGLHRESAELLLSAEETIALTRAGPASITFVVAVALVALRTVFVVGGKLRTRVRELRAVESSRGVWWGTGPVPDGAAALDPLLGVWWGTAVAAGLMPVAAPWWLYWVLAPGVLLLAHAALRAITRDEAAGVLEEWRPPEGWRGPS